MTTETQIANDPKTAGWLLANVPHAEILLAANYLIKRRGPNRLKVMRPCPHCQNLFGAFELQAHQPSCPKRPIPKRKTKNKKLVHCRYGCGAVLGTMEMKIHEPACDQKLAVPQ